MNKISILVIYLIISAAPALFSVTVRSQEPTEEEAETAKELFQRGVILYEAGDYKGALKNFLQSYALHPHFKIKFNIGMCYFHTGNNALAANELEALIEEQGDQLDAKVIHTIKKTLKNLKEKLGIVTINVDAEGADIFIDKKMIGKSPLPRGVHVEPGKHKLKVIAANGSHWSGSVDIGKEEKLQVNVVIEEIKKVAKVEKVQEAEFSEEGVAGEKAVKTRSKKGRISRAYFYTFLGLSAAAIIVGSITGGVALKKSNEIDDLDRACIEKGWDLDWERHQDYLSDRHDLYDEAEVLSKVSTAFLITSGAMVATSVLLFVFSMPGKKERKKEQPGKAAPLLLPQGGGLCMNFVF